MLSKKAVQKVKSGFIFVLILSLLLLGAEFIIRGFIEVLPPPVLVYLHKDIKNNNPNVNELISEINPWSKKREMDPYVGWTFIPDKVFEGKNEAGEKYKRRSSRDGFFTPDTPKEDKKQLVILGDSFLSTFYVKNPIAWVIRENIDIPVYNLAVAGWGPEQYKIAFNKYACGRKLAGIVPVFTFNNDVTDVNNWQQWKSSGKNIHFIDWIWNENPDKESINNHNSWLDRYSVLFNWIKYATIQASKTLSSVKDTSTSKLHNSDGLVKFQVQGNKESFSLKLTSGYLFSHYEPKEFIQGGDLWVHMEKYFSSLDRLSGKIEDCGGKMLLVWIPAKERVYFPILKKELFNQYVSNESGQINGYEYALNKYTNDRNIPFLDLTPFLIAEAKRGEKLYFTYDGHLNQYGNEVVGKMVSEYIKNNLHDHIMTYK